MSVDQFKVRVESVEENEKHLANPDQSSSEEGDMSGDSDGDDMEKIKQKLAKFNNGANSDDTESDDSDYDFQAGDMALYDSTLDEIDELAYL